MFSVPSVFSIRTQMVWVASALTKFAGSTIGAKGASAGVGSSAEA